MTPFVSVIIPAYKNQYIRDAIDSVLQQTYQNFEIVVIDDGSPNHLFDVLKDYIQKEQIRYIFQNNTKMAGAKNTGMRLARGELLAFLDDDDLWEKTKLEKQVEIFLQYPDVGISYTWAKSFRDEVHESYKDMSCNTKAENQEFAALFCKHFYFANSTVMIRKDCLNKAGYLNESPEYYGIDDTDLWIRILRYYKAKGIYEPLMFYRLHNNQASRNTISMLERSYTMREKYILEWKLPKFFAKQMCSITYNMLAYEHLEIGHRLTAAQYYLKSLYHRLTLEAIIGMGKIIIPYSVKKLYRTISSK